MIAGLRPPAPAGDRSSFVWIATRYTTFERKIAEHEIFGASIPSGEVGGDLVDAAQCSSDTDQLHRRYFWVRRRFLCAHGDQNSSKLAAVRTAPLPRFYKTLAPHRSCEFE